MLAVGVDVGGTKIATALLNRQGEVLAQHSQPTCSEDGVSAVLDRIAAGVAVVTNDNAAPVAGVGIGCPGPVDQTTGISLFAANLGMAWQNINLPHEIQRRLPTPTPIWAENDVNAGALGELYFGAAQGYSDFIYLTIGTGLGGCAVLNKRVLPGANYFAMEVGHISQQPDGRACTCGRRGCTEMYVSGKAMLTALEEYLPDYPASLLHDEPPTTESILKAARAGDALAVRIMTEAAEALGVALAWVTMILNPPLIVIGGGLGHAADDLIVQPALAVMRDRAYPSAVDTLVVARSQVMTSALGAGALVWHGLAS